MYGRIIDGVFERAPKNFIANDGRTIINFDEDENVMAENGFKIVYETVKPDDTDSVIYVARYSDNDNQIDQSWEAIEIAIEGEENGDTNVL